MVGVARHAVADDLGVDLGAARLGMLQRFQDDDAGALAHDETVAVLVVGARGGAGTIVEARRQRAAGGKAGHGDAADGRFRAAGHHHVGVAQRHQSRCIADGMRAGRAGGDDRVVGTLQLVPDRHVAGGEIDETPRNKEWADATRAFFLQQDRRFGDAGQATDARADEYAGPLLLIGRVGDVAGIGDRLLGRRHRVDDEVVDLALLLRLHPIVGIELAVLLGAARNEAGHLTGQIADLELLDAARAVGAGKQRLPRRLDAAADGRDDAKSCNDDATHHGP